MKIVLDTNVLVSGLLSPYGHPAEIMRMVVGEEVQLCYDARTVQEYQDVLQRAKFGFDADDVEALIRQIRLSGRPVTTNPLKKRLPHKDDEPFVEIAISGEADCLVTGNLKHFPKSCIGGVRILTPAEFLNLWRKHGATKSPKLHP
jgi:uncharacterized protein